ncbi:MAG: glycosyltransferase family 4 protein [Planctomycetota bacterium]|nr:glycosyltransferase family 4 protein [Planctomycetota bacterium]
MPRRLLIISYAFPPYGGGGVQRTVRFLRYLGECGWQASVLAPHWGEESSEDPELLASIPSEVRVIRAGNAGDQRGRFWQLLKRTPYFWRFESSLKANYNFPDHAGWWRHIAIRTASKMLREWPCDIIYSTSPPVTAHWVAQRLKSIFGLPWVADFRDPFLSDLATQTRTLRVRQRQLADFKHNVYRDADLVIANTRPNRDILVSEDGVPNERTIVIPNGYDEADFASVSAAAPSDVFRVTFCGSAYGAYNPSTFFDALSTLIDEDPELRLEVCLAGRVCKWAEDAIHDPRVKARLRMYGYLPHAQIPPLLAASHLLLQANAAGHPYSVSGKLFEYLRSGTPILAIGENPSEVSRILDETGRGKCLPREDVSGIASHVRICYDSWRQGSWRTNMPCNDAIRCYDARVHTQQLATHLTHLVGGSTHGTNRGVTKLTTNT